MDPSLDPDVLLYRLFHEDGCEAFPALAVHRGCRCSEDRIIRVVESLDAEEVEHMKVDGAVTLTCEFCGIDFLYKDGEVEKVFKKSALKY